MESKTKKHTRQKIQNAFVELLSEKELNKVRVSDIVKKAQINRSTFYEYYTDIYSLLTDVEDSFLDEFQQQLDAAYPKLSAEYSDEIFSLGIDLLHRHGDLFFALLGSNGDPAFQMRFIENIKSCILSNTGLQGFTPRQDTLFNFEMAGVIGVYTKWYDDGRQQPLEDIVKMLQEILFTLSRSFIR